MLILSKHFLKHHMGQNPTHLGNLCFMERVVLFTFQKPKIKSWNSQNKLSVRQWLNKVTPIAFDPHCFRCLETPFVSGDVYLNEEDVFDS